MARKTAAERKQEAARMRQLSEEARVNRERAEYPARLMNVFERLNNQYNFELVVKNGVFVVTTSRERFDEDYQFAYSYDAYSYEQLESLEFALTSLEEAQAEERRRNEVRREAHRKAQEVFTAEERELLGL